MSEMDDVSKLLLKTADISEDKSNLRSTYENGQLNEKNLQILRKVSDEIRSEIYTSPRKNERNTVFEKIHREDSKPTTTISALLTSAIEQEMDHAASANEKKLCLLSDCLQQYTDASSPASYTKDVILPSRITDENYIFCYNASTILADPQKTGKWLLYCNNKNKGYKGMTDLDRAWLKAVDLVKTTKLPIIRAKCSTAYDGEMKQRREDPCGIIMFYTPDYTNKMEVKKIAEEINRNVSKSTLTYKTDEASRRGQYEHHGKKNICMYKFQYGELYEKSPEEKWVRVVEDCSDSLACGESFKI